VPLFAEDDIVDQSATSGGAVSFVEMGLSRPLLKAIAECDFTAPTPIQAQCIPVALAARDICACAVTGSGEILVFMIN
jgi:ATP-dependent RNA helicase DDX27